MDDFDMILAGQDPLGGDPGWGGNHRGTVTRRVTPRRAPALAWRLRIRPAYRWLIRGRTGRCSCGWSRRAATRSAINDALGAHVWGRHAPLVDRKFRGEPGSP